MFKVAAIQMLSCGAVGPNLVVAKQLIKKAVDQGCQLIVLPECFALMASTREDLLCVAEFAGKGRIQDWAAKMASEFNVWIVAGTIPIQSLTPNKVYGASLVFNTQGEQVARYDKQHMFDVGLMGDGQEYNEADTYEPGNKLIVADTPFGRIGMTVCYDLRFPELYRQLREKGVDIFVVPSAFTAATGRSHWKVLLRARAIENQCYVIAANQGGQHDNGRSTYGYSCVIGPWGVVLDHVEKSPGMAIAEIDPVRLQVLREEFPVWEHRRL